MKILTRRICEQKFCLYNQTGLSVKFMFRKHYEVLRFV